MYTIVRFTADSELTSGDIERFGQALNRFLPGSFEGLRRAGDGFACAIADSIGWGSHRGAILDFVRAARPAIRDAVLAGVNVQIDVAIEPEDVQEMLVLSILVDAEMSSCLSEAGVELVLSYYSGPN